MKNILFIFGLLLTGCASYTPGENATQKKNDSKEFFSAGGLIEFAKWINKSKEALHPKPIYFKREQILILKSETSNSLFLILPIINLTACLFLFSLFFF